MSLIEEALNKAKKEVSEQKEIKIFLKGKKRFPIFYIGITIFLCIIIFTTWGWKKFRTEKISKPILIKTIEKSEIKLPNRKLQIVKPTSAPQSNVYPKKIKKNVSKRQNRKIKKKISLKQKQSINLNALLKQAYYQMELGHLDKALKIYNKILNINPAHPEALINRGIIWQMFGNFEKAQKDLLLAYQYVPKDKTLLNALGVNYLKQKKFEEAKKYFLEANDVMAMINLAVIAWKTGELNKVNYYFQKALALDPTNPYVYYYLGIFYQQQGMERKAEQNFNISKKLALEKGEFSLLKSLQERN